MEAPAHRHIARCRFCVMQFLKVRWGNATKTPPAIAQKALTSSNNENNSRKSKGGWRKIITAQQNTDIPQHRRQTIPFIPFIPFSLRAIAIASTATWCATWYEQHCCPSSPVRPVAALRWAKLSLNAPCFIAPLLRLFYASASLLKAFLMQIQSLNRKQIPASTDSSSLPPYTFVFYMLGFGGVCAAFACCAFIIAFVFWRFAARFYFRHFLFVFVLSHVLICFICCFPCSCTRAKSTGELLIARWRCFPGKLCGICWIYFLNFSKALCRTSEVCA